MLPASIMAGELAELVARSASRTAEFTVADCARLAALVARCSAADQSVIHAVISFAADAEGRPLVRLQISATLLLECQRCLEPFAWQLDEQAELRVLRTDEEAAEVGEPMDTVLLNEHGLDVAAMVEDEIIAALPLSARHPDNSGCQPGVTVLADDEVVEEAVRPFAGLADMLGQRRPS